MPVKKLEEHAKRSFAKSLSWRVIATITTMILVFLFTGEFSLALGVGAVEFILKILIYYAHERVWNNITWGETVKTLKK